VRISAAFTFEKQLIAMSTTGTTLVASRSEVVCSANGCDPIVLLMEVCSVEHDTQISGNDGRVSVAMEGMYDNTD
jgi:hypothetical protein